MRTAFALRREKHINSKKEKKKEERDLVHFSSGL